MTMNQDNQVPGQNDSFASGGEEFVFTEERKPVNRNLMVLLVITVVGAAMIYVMYLRNKAGSGADDESTRAKSQQVADFIQKGEQELKILDEQLKKMETDVTKIVGDTGASQVPTDRLKINPFESPKAPAQEAATQIKQEQYIRDPKDAVQKIIDKTEVQMISVSARGSTCILNSKLCQEGDNVTIDDQTFTVKRITADSVTLEHRLGSFRVNPKGGKGL